MSGVAAHKNMRSLSLRSSDLPFFALVVTQIVAGYGGAEEGGEALLS